MADLTYSVRLTADGNGLKGELRVTEAELRKLRGETVRTTATARQASTATERWGRSVGFLRRDIGGLQSALAGLGIGLVVRDIAQVGLQTERWTNSLRAATGSIEGAASEMAFLRREADRLGLPLESITEGYVGFAAALKGTALEGQAGREVFTAVAEASRVMGLRADETEGALRALQQMVSKGTVASEELRGQLGERLPGAFQIAARAMGVTTMKLGDMLQKGEVLAEDLLPKFARELRKSVEPGVAAAVGSAAAEFARMDNAIRDLKQTVAESGLLLFLTQAAVKVKEFAGGVGLLLEQVGALDRTARVLATGSLGEVLLQVEQLTAQESELLTRIDALDARLARPGVNGASRQAQYARRDELQAQSFALTDQIKLLKERAEALRAPAAAVTGARGGGGAPSGPSKEAEDFAKAVAKLRDELDPAGAALRQYSADMAVLERAHAQGKISGDELASALLALNEGYDETIAKLDGSAEASAEFEGRLQSLRDKLLPASRAARTFYDDLELLNEAMRLGRLSSEEYETALFNLNIAWDEAAEKMGDFVDSTSQAGEQWQRDVENWTGGFARQFADMLTGAETDFRGFLHRMVTALLESQISQLLTGAVGGIFGGGSSGGGILGSLVGAVAGLFHEGGVVGQPGPARLVPAAAFAGAPRFHSGGVVGSDEVPAILRRGEVVLTPEQASRAGGVTVTQNISIDARGADEAVESRIRAAMDETRAATIAQIVREVNAGGAMARTLGRRRS